METCCAAVVGSGFRSCLGSSPFWIYNAVKRAASEKFSKEVRRGYCNHAVIRRARLLEVSMGVSGSPNRYQRKTGQSDRIFIVNLQLTSC